MTLYNQIIGETWDLNMISSPNMDFYMVISKRKPVGNKFQSRANNDQRINPREQYWTSKPSTSHQHNNIIHSYDIGWYILFIRVYI